MFVASDGRAPSHNERGITVIYLPRTHGSLDCTTKERLGDTSRRRSSRGATTAVTSWRMLLTRNTSSCEQAQSQCVAFPPWYAYLRARIDYVHIAYLPLVPKMPTWPAILLKICLTHLDDPGTPPPWTLRPQAVARGCHSRVCLALWCRKYRLPRLGSCLHSRPPKHLGACRRGRVCLYNTYWTMFLA